MNKLQKRGREKNTDKETSKNGGNALSAVPAPLDGVCTGGGDTDTDDGGDDGVGCTDGPAVASRDQKPGGTSDKSASKTEHLYTGVVLEGGEVDDAAFDCASDASTDENSAEELAERGSKTGLTKGQGAGGDGGGERVGDIVRADVELSRD